MIEIGQAGLIRDPDTRQQYAGFFVWKVSGGQDVSAKAFWLNTNCPQTDVRIHLFGDSGDREIGCLICLAEVLTDLEIFNYDTLYHLPLNLRITEVLQFDKNAVHKNITLHI